MSASRVNLKLTPKIVRPEHELEPPTIAIERFFNSRIRLSQIRMLVAIDELGQLKKVAQAMNVTPPAISKQLSEIEDALQQKVLQRVGNKVQFTEVGAVLARHARAITDQLARTRMEVDQLCAGVGGHIGLGAVPTVAPFFLPALVTELKHRAPGTEIRLREAQFEKLAPLLDDETLDVVLARDTGHRLSVNFREEKVLSDPIAVVCGSQHRLTRYSKLHWKDLDGEPWVLPERGSSTFLLLQKLLAKHSCSLPPGCVESISLSVNLALIQVQPFLALVPLTYARRDMNRHLIKVLPLSTGGMQNTIKAVWRKDNSNPMVEVLLHSIRAQTLLL